jgi:hypothetical protein
MMKTCGVLGAALLAGGILAAVPGPAAAELKVSVSGYVKLDLQWSDKILGGGFPSPAPADTPLDQRLEADHSQTLLDTRQTRFRVTASDEVAGVKLSSRVEADFFSADGNARVSNSRHLRLRHAHAGAEHPSGFFTLFGQTWTLFMNDEVGYPDTVDFNGPVGQIFARQPQIRIGWKSGDLRVMASVEKQGLSPVTADIGSGTILEAQGEGQDVPLIVGKIGWYGKMFQAEAAGAYSNSKVILPGGGKVNEAVWAGQFSAQVTIGPASIFGHYQRIEGLQRLANGDFPDTFVVGADIVTVRTDGYYAGATYRLTPQIAFTAVYGWQEADDLVGVAAFQDGTTGVDPKALRRHQSVHVNVIYKFWQRMQAGLEYRRFWVDTFNNPKREGDVNFVHGALWFFF